MSRLPSLYTILSSIVAASTMACSCPPPLEETIAFDPQAETFRASFERCELDPLDCEALCTSVYKLMYGAQEAEYLSLSECELVDLDGQSAVHYVVTEQCIGGRLPAGAKASEQQCSRTETGAWLAKLAELEEASVYAFAQLSVELKRFGAPLSLSQRCLQAAADEVRHARMVRALAKRYGAESSPIPKPTLVMNRSLAEVAIENATEGCVRETFGALVAVWQSQHAEDVQVRVAMLQISIDESRHAQLSADINTWAKALLSKEQRVALDQSQALALAALQRGAAQPVSAELAATIGLPDAAASRDLFALAQARIWT